jgi:hypothetical protein
MANKSNRPIQNPSYKTRTNTPTRDNTYIIAEDIFDVYWCSVLSAVVMCFGKNRLYDLGVHAVQHFGFSFCAAGFLKLCSRGTPVFRELDRGVPLMKPAEGGLFAHKIK